MPWEEDRRDPGPESEIGRRASPKEDETGHSWERFGRSDHLAPES